MGTIERIVVYGLSALAVSAVIAGFVVDPAGMREGASILTCGKPSCACGYGPFQPDVVPSVRKRSSAST